MDGELIAYQILFDSINLIDEDDGDGRNILDKIEGAYLITSLSVYLTYLLIEYCSNIGRGWWLIEEDC